MPDPNVIRVFDKDGEEHYLARDSRQARDGLEDGTYTDPEAEATESKSESKSKPKSGSKPKDADADATADARHGDSPDTKSA